MVIKLGVITIKIKDHIEKLLREEALRKYGGKKGSLSLIIEEALLAWLKGSKKGARFYQIIKNDKIIFQSDDLDEISKFLNENEIKPNEVIIKIKPSKKEYRIGPRL